MIQANELRIGNIVSIPSCGVHATIDIVGAKRFCITHNDSPIDADKTSFDLSDGDGIPLSERWLLKFGFEKTITETKHFKVEYIDYRMGQFVLFLLKSGGVEVEFCAAHNTIKDRGYLVTVQHVHQLQNLYFALTGKEIVCA